MQSKERLCWVVTGGVMLGIIIGLCISPLTAQDGNFGEITCTSLRVVNADGKEMATVMTGEYGGDVRVKSKDRTTDGVSVAIMSISSDGAGISLLDKSGIHRIQGGMIHSRR